MSVIMSETCPTMSGGHNLTKSVRTGFVAAARTNIERRSDSTGATGGSSASVKAVRDSCNDGVRSITFLLLFTVEKSDLLGTGGQAASGTQRLDTVTDSGDGCV